MFVIKSVDTYLNTTDPLAECKLVDAIRLMDVSEVSMSLRWPNALKFNEFIYFCKTWAKMSPTCIILENQLVDSGINKRRQKIVFVLYFFTSHPRHLSSADIFQKKLFSEAWKDHDVHHALTLAQSREKVVVIYLRIRKFRLRNCLVTRQYHPAVMR